jgi:hypothetical protein
MSGIAADLKAIHFNADRVVAIAREELGVPVGFDQAGVRWLDDFIQRAHERGDAALRGQLVHTLGSYLGQCIVETFGGGWAEVDGAWGVRFDERHAVFPFAKVAKQLEHGSEDSVLSFFGSIPAVFASFLGRGSDAQRRTEDEPTGPA